MSQQLILSGQGSFSTDYVPEICTSGSLFEKFPQNTILLGEDEAFQIRASILIAFCRSNLSVDDLFKLKSILSRFSNDKVTLRLKGFFRHYEYRNLTLYHFVTDF